MGKLVWGSIGAMAVMLSSAASAPRIATRLPGAGQTVEAAATDMPNALWVDPAPQPAHPPRLFPFAIRSFGDTLNALLYTAAGRGPHPTVLLLHGLPGNEQNLDLAQAMRRKGWNVLTFHYRGSWGSTGAFSFVHCTEDVASVLAWLRAPASEMAAHIDPTRIVVIGHSMGGVLAAYAGGHDPALMAVGMISAVDVPWRIDMTARPIGTARADTKSLAEHIKAIDAAIGASAGMTVLAGTSPRQLARELIDHAAALDFVRYHAALGRKPLLLVSSDDGFSQGTEALAHAIQDNGGRSPTLIHLSTDHSYSDARIQLTTIILRWLDTLVPPIARGARPGEEHHGST